MVETVARRPSLSVVVVVYNMAREAPRTLYSLSAEYQRNIHPDDYEVIVVDNGSNPPFEANVIKDLSGNFRLIRIDHASPSPAHAVNRGIAAARGEVIGVMIDGARMVTPGLLHFARHGAAIYDRAVVATLNWHLGSDLQRWAIRAGYGREHEDALLKSISWPDDGYRLFQVATMDGSSFDGWLAPIGESNALFMQGKLWKLIGGMEERFDAPGGGLVNLDTFRRACELPGAELVILLGEATFHQLHGGAATGTSVEDFPALLSEWGQQYEAIRGNAFSRPLLKNGTTYLGTLPRPVLARFVRAAIDPVKVSGQEPALGSKFDPQLWSPSPVQLPTDAMIGALVELAQNEFRAHRYEAAAAVSRLIRERAPEEEEPQRLLSLIGSWLSHDGPPTERRAEYHCALGAAYKLLGETEASTANYRAALTFDSNLALAHLALADLRMLGDGYLTWLERLYEWISPETVIEIGVYLGSSLALLRSPTIAIAVDPAPMMTSTLRTETHVFVETSDEFFAQRHHEKILGGQPMSVGFIDGLHLFEQALRDFINLESCSGARSVILFHDTVPLDEPTQTRTRNTQFHTGDVWKTILCLKHYRPDLDVFTIATPPTGLTVVTGLDPTSSVLTVNYEEAVARFIDLTFASVEPVLDSMLNVIANDQSLVKNRLKQRGILR